MDIQRGDQVYYRGEVWTVEFVHTDWYDMPELVLVRPTGVGGVYVEFVCPGKVQRVEQVR